jgi:hypothetical protein
MQDPGARPKGPSTLAVVLAVIGGVLVLGVGTCVAAGVYLGDQAKKAIAAVAEGGLVLDDGGLVIRSHGTGTPEEVKTALAGPKRGYVGSWKGDHGSTLTIRDAGDIDFVKHDAAGGTSKMNGQISAFVGDGIEVWVLVTMTLKVTEPPHKVGGQWEMTVDGVHLQRQ